MHSIRRAVFRAVVSPSASLISKSRPISTTSSSSLLRPRIQSVLSQSSFRRFASDDADRKPLESADGETGAVQSAVDSVTGTASNMANSAAQAVSNSVGYASEATGAPVSPPPSQFIQRELSPTKGVYVGNILFDVTAEDLRREFSQFGPIESTTIASDVRGLSKGFGYVEFENVEHATAAIQARNQTVFEGRRIIVNYMATSSRTQEKNPPSKTLFIGNLAFEMSDADLNKLFREVRNVIDVRVAIDRRTGQPRGFAHADFVDVESAKKALEALQGREIYGRSLRVDFSGTARDRNPVIKP